MRNGKSRLCLFSVVLATMLFLVGASTLATKPVEIRGKVIDEDDQPLAGAVVYVDGRVDTKTKSNDDGTFRLISQPDAINHFAAIVAICMDREKVGISQIWLKEGEKEIPEQTVRLSKARVIEGIVVDDNDDPVEGAIVAGRAEGGIFQLPESPKTDREGRFRFIHPEMLFAVLAYKDGVGFDYFATRENILLESSIERYTRELVIDGPFHLRLGPLEKTNIKVVDTAKKSVPGVHVHIESLGKPNDRSIYWDESLNLEWFYGLFRAETNRDGIAVLELPKYISCDQLAFSRPREGGGFDRPLVLSSGKKHIETKINDDGSGDVEKTMTFELQDMINYRGKVVLEDGSPVPWINIVDESSLKPNYISRGIIADDSGNFEISARSDESLFLYVLSSCGVESEGILIDPNSPPANNEIEFVLKKGIRVFGNVTFCEIPVDDLYIRITLSSRNEKEIYYRRNRGRVKRPWGVEMSQAHINHVGEYELVFPATVGSYEISIEATSPEGGRIERVHILKLKGDETEVRVDFQLLESHETYGEADDSFMLYPRECECEQDSQNFVECECARGWYRIYDDGEMSVYGIVLEGVPDIETELEKFENPEEMPIIAAKRLEGAKVTMFRPESQPSILETKTDKHGRFSFTFTRSRHEPIALMAESPGGGLIGTAFFGYTENHVLPQGVPYAVASLDEDWLLLRTHRRKSELLNGILEDTNGNPISGARVYGMDDPEREMDEFECLFTTSDAEGRFTLLPNGHQRDAILALKPGYAITVVPLEAADNENENERSQKPIKIQMSPAEPFQILLADEEGDPIQRCTIQPQIIVPGIDFSIHFPDLIQSNAEGAIEIDWLPTVSENEVIFEIRPYGGKTVDGKTKYLRSKTVKASDREGSSPWNIVIPYE